MRRTIFSVAALVLIFAAGVAAAPQGFYAFLDGPSEEPANASPGTGVVVVTIDSAAHTLRVESNFSGLVAVTTAAHIHVINGPGDANLADTIGPVATTTPSFPAFPLGVTSGSMDQTYDMTQSSSYRAGWITDSGGTIAAAEAELFNAIIAGRAYFNIHSSTFTGGEIRGFLIVPEPGSVGILGAGALLLLRRRTHA